MKSISISSKIRELVAQTPSNPFTGWPYVTKEEIDKVLCKSIQDDGVSAKSFIYEDSDKAILYFQIQHLTWDTNHFGYKCAKINHLYIDETISYNEVNIILNKVKAEFNDHLKHENIRFLVADINSYSKNASYFIQSMGFKFVLNWIDGIIIPVEQKSFESKMTLKNLDAGEVEKFSIIAKHSYYKGGRFYTDKNFDQEKVDELYGELVKNSYQQGDILLSWSENGIPIGIFIYKKIKTYEIFNNLRITSLRFFLINPAYRGNSYGYKVFISTIDYLKDKCDIITTGLESHNFGSLNLHTKVGFKYNYSHNAFHYWNL